MRDTIPVENRANLLAAEFDGIAAVVEDHRSIKRAIDWLARHEPRITLTDVVAQDEYSHDILVEYIGGLWLVYDST